jgi:D-tyrosyl-tRNA(Tyr) deacylase
MRVVLQRVSRASVEVGEDTVASIGHGFLALVGVGQGDAEPDAVRLAEKVASLRVFADDAGKMNRSVLDVAGEVLVVSQFTLYADVRKGRRPSWTDAAEPERASALVEAFAANLERQGVPVERGVFGAHMRVELVNDGPVTILLDTAAM